MGNFLRRQIASMKYMGSARTATARYGADQERVLAVLKRFVYAVTTDTLPSHVDDGVKFACTYLLRELVPVLSAPQLCAMLELAMAAKAADYTYVSTLPLKGKTLAPLVNAEQFEAAVNLSKEVLRKDFPIDAFWDTALPVTARLGGNFASNLKMLGAVVDRLARVSVSDVLGPFLKEVFPAAAALTTEAAVFWRTVEEIEDFSTNAHKLGVPVSAAIKGLCLPAAQCVRELQGLSAILRHACSEDLKRIAAEKAICSTMGLGTPLARFVEFGLPEAASPGSNINQHCANLDALADLYAALCRSGVDWWFIDQEQIRALAKQAVELRMKGKTFELDVSPHEGFVRPSPNRMIMYPGGGAEPERVYYETRAQAIRIVPKKVKKK